MPSSSEAVTSQPVVRATVLGAFLEGWRRVIRAPMLTAGVMAVTFLTALPLAMVLQASMEQHLGASAEADRVLAGWSETWAQEFSSATPGLGRTFTHDILGFGGTLSALSRLLESERLEPALLGAVVVYLLVWTFLSGGILDRVARGRAVRTEAFFGACGVYFLRFIRLFVPVGLAYWALFVWFRPLLFSTVYDRVTRDLANEHQVIILRGTLYVADFAKVRMVVEDRRSAIGALDAALRFIRRRPGRVIGLYLVNVLAVAVIARLWLQTAPAASSPLWLAMLGAEVYLLCRIWARLGFMASEVVFFQGELAHATFARAPEPLWPDSPSVEAINNLQKP
jgi:hypothetical protein